MNSTGAMLVVIVCFVGGYAIVAAILRAFFRPKQDPQDQYYRAVLGVSARASEFEIQAAYRQLSAQYQRDPSPDHNTARAQEINEAYDYFKRQYGFQ